jgi:hypothetical protein
LSAQPRLLIQATAISSAIDSMKAVLIMGKRLNKQPIDSA